MIDKETTTPTPETSPDPAGAPVRRPSIPSKARRLLSSRATGWLIAGVMSSAVLGLSVDLATTTPTSAATSSPASAAPHRSGGALPSARGSAGAGSSAAGAGSNARSGPAAGGASGTVSNVSQSSFTLTTSAGQKVTVDEASGTRYLNGTSPTSAVAVTSGANALVLGTTSGTTIEATQVTVNYTPATPPSTAAQVVPFQRGAPTTSKQVGQIPANWSFGSGTIVSGSAADQATAAALAAFPGGVVDRVVQLSSGEYNVHYIGVNWPHHVFVSSTFQVVGAL